MSYICQTFKVNSVTWQCEEMAVALMSEAEGPYYLLLNVNDVMQWM